ncbi:MAG: methyltransferase domain-containing protein [bacterium]
MVCDNRNKKHRDRIIETFTRQADTISAAPVFTDRDMMDEILSAVLVSSNMRILDVGCGPGIVTEKLAAEAAQVVAFDLTPEMVTRARDRCEEARLKNVRFDIGQAEKLPFKDDTFNAVVTRFTFHHFSDPAIVLSEMVRVTRHKGRVVIVDAVSSEIPEESELHNAFEILRDPATVRLLPYSSLKKLVDYAGLSIETQKSWIKQREFDEWIGITNVPDHMEPIRVVMCNLAKAGIRAGIDLRFNGRTVSFNHHLVLIAAVKP